MNGKIYGLRIPNDSIGVGGGIWISQKYLDEVGFTYMENAIYTKEELEELFAQLKELYPDCYPLGQITSDNEFSTFSYYYDALLTIGSVSNIGYVDENEKLANLYESDQYWEFLSLMKHWYDTGYIYPDAAFTDASQLSLLQEGIILSVPFVSSPGFVSGPYGDDLVCLMTTRVTYGYDNSSRNVFWTVPETSEEPKAAMRFLNLMYTDERIVNLLQWGIEGIHYEFVDENEGIIAYPEGKDAQTAGYYNPLGLYGNQQLNYAMEGSPTRSEKQAYSELAEPFGWEYADFIFDSSEVSVELVNIQNVLSRYYPALESGGVDLETMYPQFVQELEDAGMSEVIALEQEQFDAWLKDQ
ncbi:MAG: ABC transporter substrate-binding protein [Clostridiales bacterium]|nr:ABC transporter substrate-binding protein [Clostridiales bacterium]